MHLYDSTSVISREVRLPTRNDRIRTGCKSAKSIERKSFSEAEAKLSGNNRDMLIFGMPVRGNIASDESSVTHNIEAT